MKKASTRRWQSYEMLISRSAADQKHEKSCNEDITSMRINYLREQINSMKPFYPLSPSAHSVRHDAERGGLHAARRVVQNGTSHSPRIHPLAPDIIAFANLPAFGWTASSRFSHSSLSGEIRALKVRTQSCERLAPRNVLSSWIRGVFRGTATTEKQDHTTGKREGRATVGFLQLSAFISPPPN